MKSGVYQIINLINGKIYIGSAIDLELRWNNHKYYLNKNIHHSPHLQNAWNKYGEDYFEFNILEECNKEDLLKREQYYLDVLKPEYNFYKIAGSPLGYKHSKESKEKNSKSKVGKKRSIETRMKISESLIGNIPFNRKFSEEEIKEIRSSRLNTVQLAMEYGVHNSTIGRIIDKKRYKEIK